MTESLQRRLGLAAVLAVVAGDMLGSGVFFTPGELAPHAQSPWHVYILWGLCGAITLCGALTLAELATRLPQAGASYAIIREAFGPFPAFLKIWIEAWVSGPGSIAGLAIVLGGLASRTVGAHDSSSPVDSARTGGLLAFVQMVGSGVAIVLFTYDEWLEVLLEELI